MCWNGRRKKYCLMNKRQLSRYYYLSLEIKEIEERIQSIRETSVGSSKITGMPSNHSVENPLEKRVELLISLNEKLESRRIKALEEMLKIEKFLATIDDIETKLIFTKRYIDLKSWEKIAMEMHMSERTVYRKHSSYLRRNDNDREIK